MPVAASVEVFAPSGNDRRRIEQPASGEALLGQELPGPRPERTPEPARDGNGEAGLGPLDQLFRHMAVKHLPQQPFAFTAPQLEALRQAPRELDYTMIENRHAHFERNRHARTIDLGEDV